MDTVRKIVETVTGDAGTDTLARQQERAGGSTRSDETSAAAAERERESRPPTQITTTTTERERRPVVEEPGSPPVETRRGLSGRSDTEAAERKTLEPSTTTTTTTTERREGGVLRTGETPLDLDKERQKREEEMIERETRARGEWSERTTGREGLERGRGEERGLYSSGRRSPEPYRRSGEYSPKHEEDKGFFERTKEFFTGGGGGGGRGLSMGGGFRDSEETRQLGLEKGQVPYEHPDEVEFVRRRYMEERRAIESGHVFEGQRLKDPEFYRSSFLRTPTEEAESERRWSERRASTGYDDAEQGARAGAGAATPRGGITSVIGKVTHALGIPVQTTNTKYPLCIRSIVHPRKDTHDSKIEGDVIFVQDHPGAPTQVIGSVRGINPGLHGLVILENGDLSLERSSAGLHFDAQGSLARHGGANTKERHLGDLGNIIVKDDGVSFFNFRVANLPLIDVAGRALAVMSGEDDLGRSECQCSGGSCRTASKGVRHRKCGPDCRGAAGGCHACISDRTGNSGHALGLGVLVRTDLLAMERLKNIHLGVGVGDETHSEVHGRTMMERLDAERMREAEYRGAEHRGGIGGAWESIKETFGGGRHDDRQALERGLVGRQLQDLPVRDRDVRGGEFVAALPAAGYVRETVRRPYQDDEEEIARRRKEQQQIEQQRARELQAKERERDRQRQEAQERDRQRQLEAQAKERERQRQSEIAEQERERARQQAVREREERLERERRSLQAERDRAEKERVEHQRMERSQADRERQLRERQAQLDRQAEAERQQQKERERQIQIQREREREREIKEQRQRQMELQERDRRLYEQQQQQQERERYRVMEERDRQRQYELQKERELYEQKSRSEYGPSRTGDYYSVERFEHPERVQRSSQGEDLGGKIRHFFGGGAHPAASGRSAHADY